MFSHFSLVSVIISYHCKKNWDEHYTNFHARVFCKPQFENECVLKSSNNQFIVGTRFSSDYQQPQNNKSRFLL